MLEKILSQRPINGQPAASPFSPVAPPPGEQPPPPAAVTGYESFDAVQVDDVVIALKDAGTDPAKWVNTLQCGQVVFKSADGAEPYLVIHNHDGEPRLLFASNIVQWFRCLLLLLCSLLAALALPSCVAIGVSYDPDANEVTGTATYKFPAGKEPIP